MKTTTQLIALLLLTIATPAWAQGPTLDWVDQFGTSQDDECRGVVSDGVDGIYITGHTKGRLDGEANAGESDAFLIKFDATGTKQWTKLLGTNDFEFSYSVATDGIGGIYFTGYTKGNLDGETYSGKSDTYLTKFDAAGNTQWTRLLDSTNFDTGTDVSADSEGRVFVSGMTGGTLDGENNVISTDIFLVKFDSDGSKEWTRMLGISSNGESWGSVAADGTGGAYVAGRSLGNLDGETNVGNYDAFLAKFDSAGNKLWTRMLGTYDRDTSWGVVTDSTGGAYVTGDINGGTFLAKYDETGNQQWVDMVSVSRGVSWDVTVDDFGGAYIAGNANGGIFLAKYDEAGNRQWTEYINTNDKDYGYGVTTDGVGGVYIAGSTEGDFDGFVNAGSDDIFLVKYTDPEFVPEPSSMLLLCLGAFALLGFGRRRR